MIFRTETRWWFGTWLFWLSIYWECHHPKWLSLHHVSEGWQKPPTRKAFWTISVNGDVEIHQIWGKLKRKDVRETPRAVETWEVHSMVGKGVPFSYEFVTHGYLSCLWLMIILSFLVGRHGKAMSNTVSKCFVAILLPLDPKITRMNRPDSASLVFSRMVNCCACVTQLGLGISQKRYWLCSQLVYTIFLMIQESGASSHAGHSKEPFLKNRCWGWTLSGSYRAVCPRAQWQNPTRYNAPSTTTTQGWQSLDSGGHQGDWN